MEQKLGLVRARAAVGRESKGSRPIPDAQRAAEIEPGGDVAWQSAPSLWKRIMSHCDKAQRATIISHSVKR